MARTQSPVASGQLRYVASTAVSNMQKLGVRGGQRCWGPRVRDGGESLDGYSNSVHDG
jgi:hypothetical protein